MSGSSLEDLKHQIIQVAEDMGKTAGAIKEFSRDFSDKILLINSLIGGTVTGIDRDLILSLEAAEKDIDSAIGALYQAEKDALSWISIV